MCAVPPEQTDARHSSLIDFDAQTWIFGNLPIAIDHSDGSADDVVIPRHGPDHFFLDHMIRSGNGKVQRRYSRNRTERIMTRGNTDASRFRHGCNLLRLKQAATMADIRLRDVDGANTEEILKLNAVNQPLTTGDRNTRFSCNLRQTERLTWREHLFYKHRLSWFQCVDISQRGGGRGRAAVKIDHDLHIGAERLPKRLHQTPDFNYIRQSGVVIRVRNEDGFERAISTFDDCGRALHQRLQLGGFVSRAHITESKMCVDFDTVSHFPSEQPPHRLAEVLTENVPERDLDSRHSRHADGAEWPEAVLAHDANKLLDIARIAMKHERLEIFYGADHGAGLPFERSLTPAIQSGDIGINPHEDPVAHLRVDNCCSDLCYLHNVCNRFCGSYPRYTEHLMWRALAALYCCGLAAEGATQDMSGNPEAALVQAAKKQPESFQAAHTLGEFYVHENKLNAAVPYLAKAYKLNPDDYNNAYDLALAYLETGATESSRGVVESLIRRQDRAELHNLLGEIEEKSGHVEQSAREYETAARMDPSETNLFDLANELLLHRGFDPAVKVLTFAIQKYPQSAQLQVALGVALYSVGQYDAALEALCRAIDLNPKDTRAFDFLGKMYDVAPQKADEVNSRLALFAREYPENAAANFYYALSLRRRSSGGAQANNEQAERLLRNAVNLKPQWPEAHYELGLLYDDESRTDEAIREYRSAVQLEPGLAKAHYHLARLYQKQGRTQLAQAEFRAFETAKLGH